MKRFFGELLEFRESLLVLLGARGRTTRSACGHRDLGLGHGLGSAEGKDARKPTFFLFDRENAVAHEGWLLDKRAYEIWLIMQPSKRVSKRLLLRCSEVTMNTVWRYAANPNEQRAREGEFLDADKRALVTPKSAATFLVYA